MTYDAPELHEIGRAEDVVQGVSDVGSDMNDTYPPSLTLEDFDE